MNTPYKKADYKREVLNNQHLLLQKNSKSITNEKTKIIVLKGGDPSIIHRFSGKKLVEQAFS